MRRIQHWFKPICNTGGRPSFTPKDKSFLLYSYTNSEPQISFEKSALEPLPIRIEHRKPTPFFKPFFSGPLTAYCQIYKQRNPNKATLCPRLFQKKCCQPKREQTGMNLCTTYTEDSKYEGQRILETIKACQLASLPCAFQSTCPQKNVSYSCA